MEDYNKTIQKQREYFNSGGTRSISFRKQQLRKLAEAIKANEQLLFDAIYKDFKKSEFDTYTSEIALIYQDIKQALKRVNRWSRKKRVSTNFVNFPARSYIIPEPLGVSLVIGAWNYPYLLSLSPVVAAIAAGCTIILKPSELPAHSAQAINEIISESFPPEYFTVVEGGVSETTALLNQKFDKIFFTGSPAVGRIVYQAAAKNLTPVTLELGGKSPAFITEDSNIKMTVRRLVWSKFLNAGQTCIAPDYIYVHKKVEQQFLDALTAEIEAAHYDIDNGNYVEIINERNTERLIRLIDQDKIYYGGNHDLNKRFIEPTVLTNVKHEDAVMQEEIFGPILPVMAYEKIDDAIAEVKKYPKPLSCYVFTSDTQKRDKILKEVPFGSGAVNEAVMHISNLNLPFGGVGDSGIGSYHGEEGFKAFTHYKSILNKPTWMELNLKYYPQTKKKLSLIKRVLSI